MLLEPLRRPTGDGHLHLARLTRFVPVAGGLALTGAAFGLVVAWHLRQLPAPSYGRS